MYFKIRRVFDFLLALCFLIILAPVFCIVAFAIKLDSKGPVIFCQQRIGKNFKTFSMYKFRSMIVNAQNFGTGVYSFVDDPRITKVGRFIRRTSLDELPQLWNIIKGDMAFVGPRSPVVGHFPEYSVLSEAYKRRFSVLPGITGEAQVVGRNEFSWDQKVLYDNFYIDKVQKYGFFYDLKIWYLTILRVFSMQSVEEKKENQTVNEASLKIEEE